VERNLSNLHEKLGRLSGAKSARVLHALKLRALKTTTPVGEPDPRVAGYSPSHVSQFDNLSLSPLPALCASEKTVHPLQAGRGLHHSVCPSAPRHVDDSLGPPIHVSAAPTGLGPPPPRFKFISRKPQAPPDAIHLRTCTRDGWLPDAPEPPGAGRP